MEWRTIPSTIGDQARHLYRRATRAAPPPDTYADVHPVLFRTDSPLVDSLGDSFFPVDALKGSDRYRAPEHSFFQASEYAGGYYDQGEEPTCGVWALANAALIAGAQLDARYLERALNFARNPEKPKGCGVRLCDILALDQATIPQTFTAQELTLRDGLWAVTAADDISVLDGNRKARFQHNTYLIENALAIRYVPVVIVETFRMFNDWEGGLHAVAIGGIRTRSDRTVEVQIVDSGLGIYWTTISHLSRSLLPQFATCMVHRSCAT